MAKTQCHPDDYDGVVAGAPGYPWLNLSASFLAAWAANHDANGAEILSVAKLPVLNKAAVDSCGTNGVIEDPRACRFDAAFLPCKAGEAPDCLTPAQVGVVRAVAAGPRDPRTGLPRGTTRTEVALPRQDHSAPTPRGYPGLVVCRPSTASSETRIACLSPCVSTACSSVM